MPRSRSTADKTSPISRVIKDELALISFLVVYVGIVSTDSYYSQFAVKYQFLNLPVSHIVYRGLTVLIDAPSLFLPYSLAFAWLIFDAFATNRGMSKLVPTANAAAYLILVTIIVITYPLAVHAGIVQAKNDLYDTSSTLPRIIKLITSKEEFSQPISNYRLLMTDANFVIVFKPLDAGDYAAVPHIKRFSKGEVYAIETTH